MPFVIWDASGIGSGSNTLTVRIQQQNAAGAWVTLVTQPLYMPSDTAVGNFVVPNLRPGAMENLRFRLSKTLLSPAIDWHVGAN
jgi:hypothetical protein